MPRMPLTRPLKPTLTSIVRLLHPHPVYLVQSTNSVIDLTNPGSGNDSIKAFPAGLKVGTEFTVSLSLLRMSVDASR